MLSGLLCVALFATPFSGAAAGLSNVDRDRGRTMLKLLKADLEKYYYDAEFRGMKLDERFKQAEGRIAQAKSLSEVFATIAQVLLDLDDSHTYFIPPARTARVNYGWEMMAIGDRVYISAVKPGSDGEAKGIKPGDEVLALDNYTPVRENLWKLSYVYEVLKPQSGVHLAIRNPQGQQRDVDVMADVRIEKLKLDLAGEDINRLILEAEKQDRLMRSRYSELGDVLVWKMQRFESESEIDEMMKRAGKHSTLLLDSRGNPGGSVSALKRLVGHLFAPDVKIADVKSRKESKPMLGDSRGAGAFKGKLIVLVDSMSASASELFARVVQLEKRGVVIGDHTTGAVMEGRDCQHQAGADALIFYGASITDADLIMTDGKSLERVGVTPDELLLPSASDLLANRDPVLSRALAMAGVTISSEEAGRIFPIEWR